MPEEHALHSRSDVDVPDEATNSPGEQLDQYRHSPAFSESEYAPLGHALHVRSDVDVPLDVTYSPGEQVVQAEHDVAPGSDHVPGAHATQVLAPVPSAE